MNSEMRIKVVVALAALLTGTPTLDGVSEQSDNLATPESFASIADTAARSAAMFTELGQSVDPSALCELSSSRRSPPPGRTGPAPPAAGRARCRWSWSSHHALLELPPAGQFRSCPHPRAPGVASGTT